VVLPKIVFATAFDQYAVKAFEVNAVDYLLKPFDKKRVAQSVQRVRAKLESGSASTDKLETLVRMLESQKPQASKILIKAGGRLFLVAYDTLLGSIRAHEVHEHRLFFHPAIGLPAARDVTVLQRIDIGRILTRA
jgi:DNA-binding LytR/AlgR family response regulator